LMRPSKTPTISIHAYEIRPRKDHRGVNLISDALPFGRLWYGEPDAISNAVDYPKFRSRSHQAVIRVYDEAGNVIENVRARRRIQKRGKHLLCGVGQLRAGSPSIADHHFLAERHVRSKDNRHAGGCKF
jgi:hypothetical protein